MNAAHNILVIKLSALGDFIQALGPMAAIRRHHPNAHITLLTTKPFEKFAVACGYFDQIWLDERPKFFDFKGWGRLKEKLNSGNFDRVYDLQNNDRTSFYLKLFSRKPEWVGVARGASHRNTSPQRTAGHAFDGHVQTLKMAGITDVSVDEMGWIQQDLSAFALENPYVLLVPGCAPEHPYKRWPAEKYAQLAQLIADWGYQPVLLGTKTEADVTQKIAAACPDALDLTGQTSLFEIVALAQGAAAAIGNDTGPMHMIGVTGCPALVLFSAHSNPVRHAPKGKGVAVLQEDNLENLSVEAVLEKFKPREEPKLAHGTLH